MHEVIRRVATLQCLLQARHIEDVAFRVTLETDEKGRESLRWSGRESGQEVTFDSEPYAGRGLKAAVAFMKLLPIESQL